MEDSAFSNGFHRTLGISTLRSLKPSYLNNHLNIGDSRLLSSPSLRPTTRSSIVTFNALQKVFRARFEDGRSHSSLNLFSNLLPDQPFLSAERPNYEELLGKTKNEFFSSTNFHKKFTPFSIDLTFFKNTTNYHLYSFPFLLAPKSDMGRFIWFDWYAKWGMVEVQASSVSRYSTLGVPYIKKPFEYNVENGEPILETETYFSRISRARKNYLPN